MAKGNRCPCCGDLIVVLWLYLLTVFASNALAGEVKCEDVAALGRSYVEGGYEALEKATDSLFGKPLMQYSAPELLELLRFANECFEKPDSHWDARAGLAAIQELRRKHADEITHADAIKRRERERAPRRMELKSGKVKISSIGDAILFHHPVGSITDIMDSPLISPDNKIYGGTITLEQEEDLDLLRVRGERGVYQIYGRQIITTTTPTYGWVRLSKKTKMLASKELMRSGRNIGVVGRYIGNIKYRTVIGEPKTAPLIEAMYIGKPE